MLAISRLNCQTNLITASFVPFALLSVRHEMLADDSLISVENRWIVLEISAQSPQRQIRSDARRSFQLGRATFVITHGMGGTTCVA